MELLYNYIYMDHSGFFNRVLKYTGRFVTPLFSEGQRARDTKYLWSRDWLGVPPKSLPLIITASLTGEIDIVELLLMRSPKSLYIDISLWGDTPLMCAAAQGYTDIVKLLLAADAKNRVPVPVPELEPQPQPELSEAAAELVDPPELPEHPPAVLWSLFPDLEGWRQAVADLSSLSDTLKSKDDPRNEVVEQMLIKMDALLSSTKQIRKELDAVNVIGSALAPLDVNGEIEEEFLAGMGDAELEATESAMKARRELVERNAVATKLCNDYFSQLWQDRALMEMLWEEGKIILGEERDEPEPQPEEDPDLEPQPEPAVAVALPSANDSDESSGWDGTVHDLSQLHNISVLEKEVCTDDFIFDPNKRLREIRVEIMEDIEYMRYLMDMSVYDLIKLHIELRGELEEKLIDLRHQARLHDLARQTDEITKTGVSREQEEADDQATTITEECLLLVAKLRIVDFWCTREDESPHPHLDAFTPAEIAQEFARITPNFINIQNNVVTLPFYQIDDDEGGNTALMLAIMGEHQETVEVLLSAGADITIKNNSGVDAEMLRAGRAAVKLQSNVRGRQRRNRNKSYEKWRGIMAVDIGLGVGGSVPGPAADEPEPQPAADEPEPQPAIVDEPLPYGGDLQVAMRAQDREAIRKIFAARQAAPTIPPGEPEEVDICEHLKKSDNNFVLRLPESTNYEAWNVDDIITMNKVKEVGVPAYNFFFECKERDENNWQHPIIVLGSSVSLRRKWERMDGQDKLVGTVVGIREEPGEPDEYMCRFLDPRSVSGIGSLHTYSPVTELIWEGPAEGQESNVIAGKSYIKLASCNLVTELPDWLNPESGIEGVPEPRVFHLVHKKTVNALVSIPLLTHYEEMMEHARKDFMGRVAEVVAIAEAAGESDAEIEERVDQMDFEDTPLQSADHCNHLDPVKIYELIGDDEPVIAGAGGQGGGAAMKSYRKKKSKRKKKKKKKKSKKKKSKKKKSKKRTKRKYSQ